MKKTNRLFAAIAAMMMTLALASCNEKGGTAAIEKLKNAAPAPEADFEFRLTEDGNGVIITRYKGKAKTLVIPATVQGLPVVRVGGGGNSQRSSLLYKDDGYVFKNSTVREVVISEGIAVIGAGAFRFDTDHDSLTTVVLPSTLKVIGAEAFSNLKDLTTINLPESLEYIGRYAFNNAGLTSVTLPKNVILESGAFDCDSLAEINIPEGNSIKIAAAPAADVDGLELVFSGTKISENIALQKKLKDAKVLGYYRWEHKKELEEYEDMTGDRY